MAWQRMVSQGMAQPKTIQEQQSTFVFYIDLVETGSFSRQSSELSF